MTKFTKISATALFALFLTACDKPANKPAETAAPEKTPAAATQEKAAAPATEAAKPATEAAKPAAADEMAQGKADLEKVLAWDNQNQGQMVKLQQELQAKAASGDPKQIEEAVKGFTAYIDDTIKSLDSLDIKNTQVVDFRNLAKDVLGLSRDVMVDSLKIASNPQDADLQKGLQTKVQDLMQKSQNLLSSQNELKTKFGIK
jgi:lipoprotein hlpB